MKPMVFQSSMMVLEIQPELLLLILAHTAQLSLCSLQTQQMPFMTQTFG
jgi:hypothetical protein